MIRKWFGTLVSTALISSLILSGCSTSRNQDNGANASGQPAAVKPGEKVTLRFSWWGSDTRHKATLAALDKYMQLNPNVKVEAEYGGFDGYEQKLKTQLAGGTAPDLIQVDQPWLYDLSQQSDVFVDINTMKDTFDLTNFDDKFLKDYSTVNGKLIGLPTGMNGMILYFNKDLFKKYNIPENTVWDWDNLLEYGKKVHDQSGGKDVLLNVDPGLVSELFKYYVVQKTGNQFVKDDFTLGFDKATAVDGMNYIKKYFDAGVIPPFEESQAYANKVEQNPKWFKGEVGMTLNFASNIPVMKKDITFKTDVAASIISKDSKNTAVVARPSQIFSINKNSKNTKEAAKLLNWLLNDKEAVTILGDARGTPASKSALKILQDAGNIDPNIAKGTEIALKTSGGPVNGITNNAELGKVRLDVAQKLAYKKVTPEQAADELITSLNAKLKELKSSK
ncbi:sugar ABC transporter substrate-binding protein [Paenibacillus sp. GP183]|uniref:ABC transporter substrate-binding protein n=1 Tax=Paenibacillus sp. GP183 TaxID=1882751 RepID=UPI00089975F5|nr:sugar ABC transporter substrate-binding protein [Paenibacillus sp. GP183]SEB55810.1 oligogalacturonide transport system substrate-binding protein [Paenibacillus sp. GP183]